MADEGLINREEVIAPNGGMTYKLTSNVKYTSTDMSFMRGTPCLTCPYEERCESRGVVNPEECVLDAHGVGLGSWVLGEYGIEKSKLTPQAQQSHSTA